MRIVVTGGRHYTNELYVWECLTWFDSFVAPITELIDGVAEGVDTFASNWALAMQITNIREPAKWRKLGKLAGFERNGAMLRKWSPEYCLAWAGGTGTNNMVRICREAGVNFQPFDWIEPL